MYIKEKGIKEAKKILIVEDEAELRKLYKMRFELESFQVLEAKNGEEAIEDIVTQHPDLVLLDIMLPFMDGLEVLRVLKSNPATKNTKVIIITALPDEVIRKKALAEGALGYFVKSQITPTVLVEAVNKELKK